MAGMGPAPKDAAARRRRNAAPDTTRIPSKRTGATPKWPFPGSPASKDESQLWAELWRKGVAVVWEQQGCHREVAQYVRWKILGEFGNLDAAKEARQLSDRLYLTPLAMMRGKLTIAADEVAAARDAKAPVRRLLAVDPGAVAGS